MHLVCESTIYRGNVLPFQVREYLPIMDSHIVAHYRGRKEGVKHMLGARLLVSFSDEAYQPVDTPVLRLIITDGITVSHVDYFPVSPDGYQRATNVINAAMTCEVGDVSIVNLPLLDGLQEIASVTPHEAFAKKLKGFLRKQGCGKPAIPVATACDDGTSGAFAF